jgi:Leucine-rich repeat (LRR) protein
MAFSFVPGRGGLDPSDPMLFTHKKKAAVRVKIRIEKWHQNNFSRVERTKRQLILFFCDELREQSRRYDNPLEALTFVTMSATNASAMTKKKKGRKILIFNSKSTMEKYFEIDREDYRVLLGVLGDIREQGAHSIHLRRWLSHHINDNKAIQEIAETFDDNSKKRRRIRVMSLPRGALRLPAGIPVLDTIEVLRFESILSIKGISSWIGKMPNLVTLDLLDNYASFDLNSFPEEMGNLAQLRELSVRATIEDGCSIPPSLWKLTNLRKFSLSLHHRGVGYHLPDGIGNLVELEYLHIFNSNILWIPSSIGKLKKLKKCHLVNNRKLHRIPEEFQDLINLEVLDLRASGVSSLPPMGKLQKLKKLNLHNKNRNHLLVEDNHLLREDMGSLPSLEELKIGNASIQTLPHWIGNFQHLRLLWMADMKELYCLPNEIGNLVALESLSLSLTGIVCLPASIGKLKNLKELRLVMNEKLQSLSHGIYELTQLERLTIVESKEMQDFPRTLELLFKNCTSLVDMVLSSCGITEIGPVTHVPRNLRVLGLRGNPVVGELPHPNLVDLVQESPLLGSLGPINRRNFLAHEHLKYLLGRNRSRLRMQSCFGKDDTNDSGKAPSPRGLWAHVLSNAGAAFDTTPQCIGSYYKISEEGAIYDLLHQSWGVDVRWHGGGEE